MGLPRVEQRSSSERSSGGHEDEVRSDIEDALAYPGAAIVLGLSYPRSPTFGVPCPTAILTAGLLLLVPTREARRLGVIPLAWSAIGGSAAFLLDVRGAALAAALLHPRKAHVER